MTRQEKIEQLQDWVRHNHITWLGDLKWEILYSVYDREEDNPIDPYEDVIFPLGMNTCDRCDEICDSEVGLFWIDGFDWQDDNPDDIAIQKGIAKEGIDYCAICYECLAQLKDKGKETKCEQQN